MLYELSEDHVLIREAVQRFAAEVVAPNAGPGDERGRLPARAWAGVAELGLLGAFVPQEHGGAGLGTFGVALAVEELSRADASLALLVAHHNIVALLVERFGPRSVAGEHLGALVSGRSMAAWVISQDGLRLRSVARQGGLAAAVSVDGTSTWVPGGADADLVALPAASGCVALVGPADPGFERGPPAGGLGLRAARACQLRFRDAVLVPFGGSADGVPAVVAARGIASTLRASVLVGLATNALMRACDYARERRQFNKPLADFQAIQWKLADMATGIDASRLLVAQAAYAADHGEIREDLAARAEIYAGQTAVTAAYEAVQIYGGNGFVREFGVERLLRDAQTLKALSAPGHRIMADALLGPG